MNKRRVEETIENVKSNYILIDGDNIVKEKLKEIYQKIDEASNKGYNEVYIYLNEIDNILVFNKIITTLKEEAYYLYETINGIKVCWIHNEVL